MAGFMRPWEWMSGSIWLRAMNTKRYAPVIQAAVHELQASLPHPTLKELTLRVQASV